jgi:uncharacterized protein YdhG (YjbR/CyaY superfamily)
MKPRPSRLEKQVQGRKKVLAMSTPVIRAHARDLESYSTSPGTVRFAPGKALPAALVRKLVRTRIAELRDH